MREVVVFSDYICPFCFIGKYRIEKLAEEIPIRPAWKPFEIHPEVPAGGIAIERFPAAMLERLQGSVSVLAAELGIEIRMPRKLPNSHLALLGGEIAREAGRFQQYHDAVFKAYFQADLDIGEIDELARIAETAGIEADFFCKSLQEKKFGDCLGVAFSDAHSLGISAVPSFVFSKFEIITGVQPYPIMKDSAGRFVQIASQHDMKQNAG
jgi:predicted DsbA family dithiol-disulfide isomerase